MFKQIILPSFIVFSLIFVSVNVIYGITHYGFGGVVVPDWYTKENGLIRSPISPTPFVKYWVNRGLMFSSIYGAVAFILTFIFTMLKYRKTKNLILSKNDL